MYDLLHIRNKTKILCRTILNCIIILHRVESHRIAPNRIMLNQIVSNCIATGVNRIVSHRLVLEMYRIVGNVLRCASHRPQ